MALTIALTGLMLGSVFLLVWQFVAAIRFPLHRRGTDLSFAPGITLLKPLKGVDAHTADCLRSWMQQRYEGPVQILFGVADEADPACRLVRELMAAFPALDAALVIATELLGPNAKVSTLAQLAPRARHEVICISDADVRVPADFLANAVAPLQDRSVGMVNCFYRFANPTTLASRIEAVAVNADFWSQVLQSNSLKRQDFALGAVMITRHETLAAAGGFGALAEYLADDYQLGKRIAKTGARIELCPLVVECWEPPRTWRQVWQHQVRWGRTIRVSQPLPYFFSILGNVSFWAALLVGLGALGLVPLLGVTENGRFYLPLFAPGRPALQTGFDATWLIGMAVLGIRFAVAGSLLARFSPHDKRDLAWLAPVKDLLQAAVWAAAFLGNRVNWRGVDYRVNPGGRLEKTSKAQSRPS